MEPADMSDMIPVTDEDRYLFDLQVRHGTAPRERASNVLRRLPLATLAVRLARCRVTPSHATRERDGAASSLPDRSIA
jgi:hypothetical protein